MGSNSGKGCGSLSGIPDVQILIVGARNDLVVLAIPLDLGRSCREVGQLERSPLGAQIVHEYEAVHTTRCEKVRVVSGEIDVGDGAVMSSKRKLDGRLFVVVRHRQVVDQRQLVSR